MTEKKLLFYLSKIIIIHLRLLHCNYSYKDSIHYIVVAVILKSKCVLNAFTYVCDLNFRVKITLYCIKIGFLHLNVYNVIFTRKTKSHTCEKAFITCSGE